MWSLPRPGIKPVSPALAGRFLTTGPPGKSLLLLNREAFPQNIYKISTTPIKITAALFFVEINKQNLKFTRKCDSPKWPNTISKIKRTGGFTLPNIRTYHKATVFKTVWYKQMDRHKNQRNRIESSEINRYIYGQLIFNKGAKTFNRKRTVYSILGAVDWFKVVEQKDMCSSPPARAPES